ncbi:hypothetical protein BTVI_60926 [Pitangus sulphuratus]|nr:hypothetical protein BTVI_60926 [Pitangus sulphuratus]
MVQTMVSQAVPLQSMDLMKPMEETHTGVGECLKEAVNPWGIVLEQGPGRDLQTHGERSPCWSRFRDLVEDPSWNSLCLKDCILWKSDPC